jgi:hypothetical protein
VNFKIKLIDKLYWSIYLVTIYLGTHNLINIYETHFRIKLIDKLYPYYINIYELILGLNWLTNCVYLFSHYIFRYTQFFYKVHKKIIKWYGIMWLTYFIINYFQLWMCAVCAYIIIPLTLILCWISIAPIHIHGLG